MKSSIKLKYGKELGEIIKDPIMLSIVVQIAFNMDEETGEARVEFSKRWEEKIRALVVMGIIEKGKGFYSLANKKIADITLKKKPVSSQINSQYLRGAENIPIELKEYYELANHFWELFEKNLKKIGGRLNNLEKAKFGKWVNPIRLMIEVDDITVDELRAMYKFLDGHQFWMGNVQSTQKLRDKFETIHNQMKKNGFKTSIKANTARTTESRRKDYT